MNELRYLEFIFNMAAISPFISKHCAKYLPKILRVFLDLISIEQ